MVEYIERGEFEYVILHEDVEIAEHKCKDYESYINGANQFRHQMINAIRKAPAADVVEVRHGAWEEERWCDNFQHVCSLCHKTARVHPQSVAYKYCPYCGAKMDGKDGAK